jgi:hypothetical protein
MHLPFLRRRVAPADLPPVSAAAVPGPLHSGLTGSLPTRPVPGPATAAGVTAESYLSGVEGLAAAIADTVSTAPVAPAPKLGPAEPTVWPATEPPISYGPIPGAAPLGGRPPLWRPGTYTVTYDRLLGLAAPAPLTVEALTASDLTTAIARDVRALTGHDVSVIADLVMDGGTIRGADGRIGSFTYAPRGGAQ